MDLKNLVWLYVVCSVGGILIVATAQPTVDAWIVTPEVDRKEGEQVVMRCVATNMASGHIVEWKTEDPLKSLRWNALTITPNRRFEYETTYPAIGQTTQVISITNLQRDDTDEYICNIRDIIEGNSVVATSSVMLSVLYFPNESFPICSPDGPITVDIGTELYMQCSSEAGNPAVMMVVNENTSRCNTYNWTTSNVTYTVMTSLHLTVAMVDDNATFQCVISSMYYPGMTRSCIIGPISVNGVTEPVMKCTREPTTLVTNTLGDMKTTAAATSYPSNTALIAGASAGGVAAPVLILILILIYRRRGVSNTKRSSPKSTGQLDHSQPHINPNAGLESHDSSVISDSNIYTEGRESVKPEPVVGTSHSGTELSRMTVDHTPIVYAKPHLARKPRNSNEAPIPHGSFDDTTEQSYTNPVFDSDNPYDTARPFRESTTPTHKPVAMVPPLTKVQKKPPPYKPKVQRASDPPADTPNQQGMYSSRPTSTPSSLLTHPEDITVRAPQDDGYTRSREATPPTYAQVTVPKNHSDTGSDVPSGDHIVYADLDLQSVPSDDNDIHTSSTEPVMYASVLMK